MAERPASAEPERQEDLQKALIEEAQLNLKNWPRLFVLNGQTDPKTQKRIPVTVEALTIQGDTMEPISVYQGQKPMVPDLIVLTPQGLFRIPQVERLGSIIQPLIPDLDLAEIMSQQDCERLEEAVIMKIQSEAQRQKIGARR